HLKTADLRFRLLQHVKDPIASLRAFNQEVARTESPFEREVLKHLTAAGFRVRTQWQAGYFRIDMVVEGGGKRLAVECDGDRYHPMEKLAEDIERQSILERLGWNFVRIRGSVFYRNPELAMKSVFSRLAELEIPPEVDVAEELTADMTLVHELEDMTAKGFDVSEVTEVRVADELDLQLGRNGADVVPTGFAATPMDFDSGEVEQLLGGLGGIFPLENFLRHIARIKGFQRLGRNVRRSLESELTKLQREGKITIESGLIRL